MQKPKQKPCKLCPKKRYANISFCYSHHREREKQKREEKKQRQLERKQSTKKYVKSQTKKLRNRCWTLMSLYIRQKGAKNGRNRCYTCNRSFPIKKLHAGHFKHNKLDFDERNIRPQCNACNTYKGGMLDEYCLRLIKENGIEWVEQLKRDADKDIGYTYDQLLKIEGDLKNKLC